jgi:hypothetical protein
LSDLEHTASKSQRDRFIETARAIGCDEDEAAFKAKLAVIARQKPKGELKATKVNSDE